MTKNRTKPLSFLLIICATLVLNSCSDSKPEMPLCGNPSKIWDSERSPFDFHMAIKHYVNISHTNHVYVDDRPMTDKSFAEFLGSYDDRVVMPVVYFDFDAHANCSVVDQTRHALETSKICSDNSCFTGDPTEPPPPINPSNNEP